MHMYDLDSEILTELGISVPTPIKMYCDNEAAQSGCDFSITRTNRLLTRSKLDPIMGLVPMSLSICFEATHAGSTMLLDIASWIFQIKRLQYFIRPKRLICFRDAKVTARIGPFL